MIKRGLDLKPHRVVSITNASSAVAAHLTPLIANEDKHHAALGESARDRLSPVLTRPDRVHIHEDSILAKALDQTIVEAAGVAALLAPVAHENRRAVGCHRDHHPAPS